MKMSEHIYLFTITDRFHIEGRGPVVVPGIPWTYEGPVVRQGDALILRTPLGGIIRTSLEAIEMVNYKPGGRRIEASAVLLAKGLHKFDIPIGTEVYLDSAASSQGAGGGSSG
ncbi:hypothetical protein JIN84_00035 [Luteolibacter yonseiensis]|uniref:Uncharacterized protein n=1 Tax=Luteolibacter yonseiensis TaxID=1144680 RepID=A0A934V9B1_9BACT|nr:hypothetical protein [Luteolibacter yonseiensis]MBK1813995.1 hypothetical protein [Luteolibacter yonseiensis]